MKFTTSVIGGYVAWIIVHYIASNAYPAMCTPYTIKGFLMSPFMVTTPHCVALRWVIDSGGNVITSMWVVLGAWCVTRIMNNSPS